MLNDVVGWIANSATIQITLPAVVVLLLVAALLRLAWPHAARLLHSWRNPEPPKVQLSKLEGRILHLYWLLADKKIDLDFLDDAFEDHRFRIEEATDHLADLGLLEKPGPGRTEYWLTPEGRNLSAELGETMRELREQEEDPNAE